MRVVVPYNAANPKTRLDPVLDPTERRDFARVMLRDVLAAIREADQDPTVLTTAPFDADANVDAPVAVDDRPLTPAVNDALADAAASNPVGVVMADLALATPTAVSRLCEADGDVVIAPGRGGGTNALVVRHPDFRVDYHGASCRDHRRIAATVGATRTELDSMRLATDVDEPADLAEVLLHGEGEAAPWLRDAGFELDVRGGRVGVARE